MNNRILTFLMKGIIGRWFFIILNLITMIFELYCIKFIIYEIMKSNTKEIVTSKSVISSFMNKLLLKSSFKKQRRNHLTPKQHLFLNVYK